MPESIYNGARIFLVDDHPAVREGLSLLLCQKGIVICGEAGSKEETLQKLAETESDLVIVDISLGGESGLDLVEELQLLKIVTLVYSMHDDAHHVETAFAAGTLGYVTKREKAAVLLDAIQEVLAGRRYISPVVAQILADRYISGYTRIPVDLLSDRELEVFRRTGEGDSAVQIAESLAISPRTVESYYARIIEKLAFNGVREMRRFAIQHAKNV